MQQTTLPTSVKVFGILNTVFGAFSLATSPLSLGNLDALTQTYQSIGLNDFTINWLKFSLWLSPLFALVLLVLGVGLLMKKPWARAGSVIYAYVSIALSVLSMVILVVGFSGAGSNNPAAIGGMVGGLIGGVVGLIYPVLTIVFLNRQPVKEAMERYR